MVPFIIVAVIAAGLLVLLVLARQKRVQLQTELDDTGKRLAATEAELATVGEQRREAEERATELSGRVDALTADAAKLTTKVTETEAKVAEAETRVAGATASLEEATETLRKRTELADAQASQIDTLSAARDELQVKLTAAEEQIVTLAARPGVVVGEAGESADPGADTLWALEVARSERSWRNSVAINPVDDPSPFDETDDPVRTAVEIEASALREDVGALIDVEWKIEPIVSSARRILVVRVVQEMLASASRVPGAARLVASQNEDDGSLVLAFEPADEGGPVLNLIPPPISSDVLAVQNENGLTVTVPAE